MMKRFLFVQKYLKILCDEIILWEMTNYLSFLLIKVLYDFFLKLDLKNKYFFLMINDK